MFDIAVIGAGAAGMIAAISAARENPALKTAVIDAMPVVGKKILATGNGRCNLSNLNAVSHEYKSREFALGALKKYDVKFTLDFFKSLGLYTVADSEGRIYPMSMTAASVSDALRLELVRLGITVITGERVKSVIKSGEFFVIDGRLRAKKIIVACGGKASPSQGSDGSGFEILSSLGHKIITPLPALVQLTSENKIVRSFKGMRAKGKMALFAEDKKCGETQGEILFTDYGLSGIASMDAQRLLCEHIKKEKCHVCIDLIPSMSEEEICSAIKKTAERDPKRKSENLLIGLLPKRIGQGLIKCLYIKNDCPVCEIKEEDFTRLSGLIKNFKVYISSYKGFENAQITRGGADVSEFNAETLESLKIKGLFCAGEVLDVDGACGGFNLQWAWSSGICAGISAAKQR